MEPNTASERYDRNWRLQRMEEEAARYMREHPTPTEPPKIPFKKKVEIAGEEKAEKKTIQCLTADRLQWYRIEYGKFWCVDHDLLDRIVSGGGLFINRSIRQTRPEGIPHVDENPTVRTKCPIRWYLKFEHQQNLPSFITYAATCFNHNGKVFRHVDADDEQMKAYLKDEYGEYKRIHSLIIEKNLNVMDGNPLLKQEDYYALRTILIHGVEEVRTLIEGVEEVGFSGNGYRILLSAETKDKLKERIDGAIKQKILDPCSKDLDYRAMRLNSVQAMKPTFQTDCNPNHPSFRYSNPSFYKLDITQELKEQLIAYQRSWVKSRYPPDVTYEEMKGEQTKIEGMIRNA